MDEAARSKLWDEYSQRKTPEIREKLILEYAPLVKLVAGRLSLYLVTPWSSTIYAVTAFLDLLTQSISLICLKR